MAAFALPRPRRGDSSPVVYGDATCGDPSSDDFWSFPDASRATLAVSRANTCEVPTPPGAAATALVVH